MSLWNMLGGILEALQGFFLAIALGIAGTAIIFVLIVNWLNPNLIHRLRPNGTLFLRGPKKPDAEHRNEDDEVTVHQHR